jgi:hypothetical protein
VLKEAFMAAQEQDKGKSAKYSDYHVKMLKQPE